MKKMALHWKIIIGMLLGVIWAVLSIYISGENIVDMNQFTKEWISPFGDIFLKLLMLVAVPLVLFSIITGISSLKDVNKLGKMGFKTVFLYLLTTMFSVLVGLVFVNFFEPGKELPLSNKDQQEVFQEIRLENRISYELWLIDKEGEFKDTLRYSNLPQNKKIVDDIYEKSENLSEFVQKKINEMKGHESTGPLARLIDMVPKNIFVSLQDPRLMLQVIFFSIFFGVCILFVPKDKSSQLVSFFESVNSVFLKMTEFIMRAAPFFVFALMAGVLAEMADSVSKLFEILKTLGFYSLIVFCGLFFMILFYPLLVSLFAKDIKYTHFWKNISKAQLMAFSTSSSAATLPVTMDCVENKVGVKSEIASFVLPIGATVNMDGTSLYQAMAVIFLAQFHMIDLSIVDQIVIVLTATLASIGSAAVPSAGLIMLMMVLSSIGLNPAWIAIILPMDRILDMCRTVVNVTGDASVATIIASTDKSFNEVNR
ncbi:MAG: dicarboxylate/amino acid:cation symporter [Flavobacteriales bacterium]|nr:dicarboxylate/amino acid:cation symporter [Flavobacteriales bacterium]